jgi:hypothetical protein
MIIPVDNVHERDISGSTHSIGILNAYISCKRPRFFHKNIKFMVDTGATMHCCLTESDMEFLGIDFSHSGVDLLPRDKWPRGFGGPIETYSIKNVVFRCRGHDGKDVVFKTNLPEVAISKGTPPGLPSVIGTRFLVDNGLKLIFSPFDDSYSCLETYK